jgi:hypothetical protein
LEQRQSNSLPTISVTSQQPAQRSACRGRGGLEKSNTFEVQRRRDHAKAINLESVIWKSRPAGSAAWKRIKGQPYEPRQERPDPMENARCAKDLFAQRRSTPSAASDAENNQNNHRSFVKRIISGTDRLVGSI